MSVLATAKGLLERNVNFVKTGLATAAAKKAIGMKPQWPAKPELGEAFIPPFSAMDQHVCFGCSPRNDRGLKLDLFSAEGWDIACTWNAVAGFENYPGMVHGGIVSTVMDELTALGIFKSTGHMPVSIDATTNWFRATKVGMLVTGAARIKAKYDSFYVAECFLFNEEGKVLAKSTGRFFTPSLKKFQQLAQLSDLPEEAKAWFAP